MPKRRSRLSEAALSGLQRVVTVGLTFDITAPRVATLRVREVKKSVEVTERRPLASLRYTEPLRDIPQTITVIPREIIEQQGATTLTEVLRNVPGLTITAGEGGAQPGTI
jgi:outer membrane receptor for monomeric catechols